MAVPCKRLETTLTHFRNGVELRKVNKKLSIHILESGNYRITFVKVLSKEEREELKEAIDYPTSFIKKGLLVNILHVTRDTLGDLAGVLEYLSDNDHIDSLEYIPEPKEEKNE